MFGLGGTISEVICGILIAALAAVGWYAVKEHFTIADLNVKVANAQVKNEAAAVENTVLKGNAVTLQATVDEQKAALAKFDGQCQAQSAQAVVDALKGMQATVARFAAIKPGTGPDEMNRWAAAITAPAS